MLRRSGRLAVWLLVLPAVACSAVDGYHDLPPELREASVVSVHQSRVPDRGSWSWLANSEVEVDAGVDSDAIERLIRSELEAGLLQRGFQRQGTGGELGIGFVIATGAAIDDRGLDRRYGIERSGGAAPAASHERGALVVDVVDRRLGRPVWRGSVMALTDPSLPEPVRRERIRRAVALLLQSFKPLGGGS
jgi:hypothetical protein